MLSLVSQFVLNGIVVCVAVALHAATARSCIGIVRTRRDADVRLLWGAAVPVILLLDLPLVYSLLLYKNWHPLAADRILLAIRYPWMLLQFNAALLALSLLLHRHVYRRFIRHIRPAPETAAVSEDNNGAESTLRLSVYTPVDSAMISMNEEVKNLSDVQNAGRSAGSTGESRRRFMKTAAVAAGGIVLNRAMLSAADNDEDHLVERRIIRIPDLPEALKGTTIGMISDIHSSVFMSRGRMERYAKLLQSLKADLIVVPGDFVNSRLSEVYPFGEAFSGLSAPLGVFGVTGNHDYYSRNIEAVAAEVEQAGIRLLRNENVRVTKNGASFRLLGMDDNAVYDVRKFVENGKTEKGRVENTLKGIADGEPTILLSHKPYPFEEYGRIGIDLTLSGHTHGGQIVLARIDKMNVSVASLASTYISGLYNAHSNPAAQMYISRGIGTAGIPIRLNCPPEVTHITLV